MHANYVKFVNVNLTAIHTTYMRCLYVTQQSVALFREPRYTISGFQHEQICTSNPCTHWMSHCACPVNHCRISKQNLRRRQTKLSLIIRSPVGKLYQTPLLPAEKDQVTRSTTQLEGQILFRMRRGITPLIPRTAAAIASTDTGPANGASTSSPPIRSLSPAATLIQP